MPPQPGELLAENNARDVLVDVRDRREKILYFEGEPRFEMKFLRRAVTDDKQLQLVVLQRTADNKYLRLEVDDPDELVGGFPKTRDELFQYRGLVLGSIEAAAFTGDQLAMLAEFVDKRGGGLLMLGGPRSFSEGGYAGTARRRGAAGHAGAHDAAGAEPAADAPGGAADARRHRPRRVADCRHRRGLGGALARAARAHHASTPSTR